MRLTLFSRLSLLMMPLACMLSAQVSQAELIRVTIENGGATGGTFVTPVFVGFHDGGAGRFDLFDGGSPASSSLQSLAEDGMTGGVSTSFSPNADLRGTVFPNAGMRPFAPTENGFLDFTVDLNSLGSDPRLLLATMVLPTNDWFLSNENQGSTNSGGFSLSGLQPGVTQEFFLNRLYDAGTEANDFSTSAGNPLFPGLGGGQNGPNQGPDENGNVAFLGFVNDTTLLRDFEGADPFGGDAGFNPAISPVRVTVTAVPEPTSLLAMGLLTAGGVVRHRRKKASAKVAA